MKKLNQTGSHLLAVLLFVVVVGVIGLAGYKVWQNNQTSTDTTTNQTKTAATVPNTINNNTDLTNVGKVLDDSSSQLDGSLNDNNLNTDLNDLL